MSYLVLTVCALLSLSAIIQADEAPDTTEAAAEVTKESVTIEEAAEATSKGAVRADDDALTAAPADSESTPAAIAKRSLDKEREKPKHNCCG